MNNAISVNLDLQGQLESALQNKFGNNYEEMLAVAIVGIMILGIVAIIVFIINKIGDYLIFKKVGEAPHKCFIPCYSEYMSYNYAGIPLVYFLMWILPIVYMFLTNALSQNTDALNIVSIVYTVIVLLIYLYKCYRISKRFGHGIGWTIGLFFLWPFFKLALGIGQSQYNKDAI